MQALKRLDFALAATATLLAGCGGSGSTLPTSPSTPPVPSTYTVSGTLTATNGGQPLSASLDVNGTAAQAAGGTFSVTLPASLAGSLIFRIDAGGMVHRETYVRGGVSRSVALDVITQGSGFDMTFYRQLVRGTYDQPQAPLSLRRWTRAPNVYLRTVDDAGAAIDAKTLDSTEQAIREAVPTWSGFQATITRGADTRLRQAGWITVRWPAVVVAGECGRADVAVEGGEIELPYKNGGGCRCSGGPEIRPRTVRHEVGHAMGFWHTDSTADLMSGPAVAGCDGQPSARELYHAAIAYKRPVGNTDPDSDPIGAVNLAPLRVP